MSKQTTITIETHSLLILRSRNTKRAWCPRCAAEAEMISLGETSSISEAEWPLIQQWLNIPGLHRTQAADGPPLICLDSLLARIQQTNSTNRLEARLRNSQKEKL